MDFPPTEFNSIFVKTHQCRSRSSRGYERPNEEAVGRIDSGVRKSGVAPRSPHDVMGNSVVTAASVVSGTSADYISVNVAAQNRAIHDSI